MAKKKTKKPRAKPEGAPQDENLTEETSQEEGEAIEGEEGVILEDEEEARAYVEEEGYVLPEGTKKIFVSADGYVFFPENESDAQKYATQKEIKLFTVTWD